ncbi:hypothetical protein D3C83_77940 [compost metagenome]
MAIRAGLSTVKLTGSSASGSENCSISCTLSPGSAEWVIASSVAAAEGPQIPANNSRETRIFLIAVMTFSPSSDV